MSSSPEKKNRSLSSNIIILVAAGGVAIAVALKVTRSKEPNVPPPVAPAAVPAKQDTATAATVVQDAAAKKIEKENEQMKANLLAQVPPGAAQRMASDPKFKERMELLIAEHSAELDSEVEAQLAIRRMVDCLNSAETAKTTIAPEEAKKLAPDGLKAEMQAACLYNAGNIMGRYPQLEKDLKTLVLPKLAPETLTLLGRRGSAVVKLAK